MARFNGKDIIGNVGRVTYRRGKKDGIISSRVKDVRQTDATKKSAKFFGGVSSFAKVVRSNMNAVGQQDTTLMTRLNKEMLAVLLQCYDKETQTFNFTNSYFSEFNIYSPLKSYLWPLPAVSLAENRLTVNIPEFSIAENIKFPASATHCQVHIQPVQYDLNGGHVKRMAKTKMMIKRSDELFAAQDLVWDVVPGTLCVVAVGLHYFKAEEDIHIMLNTPEFSPSAFLFAEFNNGRFSQKLTEVTKTEVAGRESIQKQVMWADCHRGFPIKKKA
ncbi:hypothetical protein [Pedobacter duraquae]|uniref:Uncharacterized protein n=1 Tax=Pedobacter duraquae TaxID=425511 RepID=A0A4R6IDV6_9SPHI|nr:hypothetical protein [Pedobacter duraquae]TDO19758.1 hypothetical protein CLV32_4382 [Pedobacter duraquae]